MWDAITDVGGIEVGHASDFEALTGCTVILCGEGMVGGVDVRGTAAGTRGIEALGMLHLIDEVHGILLTGGSAFGLDAVGGAMAYLEEKGEGFDVGITAVPIVPAAVIFDLYLGHHRVRPNKEMGYRACINASGSIVGEGSVGAGTGASVGKLFGIKQAMKGGLGTASITASGVTVGALVAVNSFGDVVDCWTGKIIAGARDSETGLRLVDSALQMRRGVVREGFGEQNTTLGVIATDASFSKREVTQIARMAHDALAKVISPAHSTFDGDAMFALSGRNKKANVNTVGLLAEEVLCKAVIRAVKKADGFGVIPAYRDLHPSLGDSGPP